ncbi:leucyl aminopeptidase [Ferviditalea candida]|uniref:Probable cytosol aminopeptidase n=1 Tax=Ferviditalea candida TaxID=3108399 RepID=A0ABU5ZHV7_9BACL|nr:leucyl aminopeptidase [Paenibacillaceae bacterium T2]
MKIQFTDTGLAEVKADLLVLGCFKEITKPEGMLAEADRMLDGAITELIHLGEITGAFKETTLLHTYGRMTAKRLLIIGLGETERFDSNRLREIAAVTVRSAAKTKAKKIVTELFGLGHPIIHEHHVTHSFAEGAYLASYQFAGYSSKKEEKHEIESIQFLYNKPSDELVYGIESGTAYAEATNLARDLINTPGNLMTPALMADKAVEIAKRHGMEYEILDRNEMEKLGMGGLLAVAQGSEQPPKMIVIKYKGKEHWEDVLGFVGKGITFDSGGISIKPGANMDEMKMDMGGAAAVLGAMEAIGKLKPKVNVLAVIPAAENLPSGKAYKPGDVIKTMSGKTIEVLNTDAEGRVALSDAISYAIRLGASRIIDVATLTGAVVVALGHAATAAMTNDDAFLADFMRCSKKAGEKVWQLPLFDEYKEQIKSGIADLKNTGGRPAGSITAALFLEAFVEDIPWIHLDIAGTAWGDKDELSPKGGKGVMVRSLAQIAKHYGKRGMKK